MKIPFLMINFVVKKWKWKVQLIFFFLKNQMHVIFHIFFTISLLIPSPLFIFFLSIVISLLSFKASVCMISILCICFDKFDPLDYKEVNSFFRAEKKNPQDRSHAQLRKCLFLSLVWAPFAGFTYFCLDMTTSVWGLAFWFFSAAHVSSIDIGPVFGSSHLHLHNCPKKYRSSMHFPLSQQFEKRFYEGNLKSNNVATSSAFRNQKDEGGKTKKESRQSKNKKRKNTKQLFYAILIT